MLHFVLRQLATSCWPFFSAYFFLGLLRRQTTIKMQTNWICVRKVWLFWLSVLRHKLTAQNGATNNNPCLFVVLCCRTRARNIFAVANDLRRKLACRYFNCNRLPGNLSGTRKCCDANCRQNLRKKKICVCPTTMVTTTAAATTMLQTRVGRQFSTHFPWLLKLILLAEH